VGINVELRDESGAVLGSILDPGMILSRFASSTQAQHSAVLKHLDPAGDLVLNRSQAAALLMELPALIQASAGPLRATLERTRALAEQCAGGTHIYLWFVGD
jgi:hypothetical protein